MQNPFSHLTPSQTWEEHLTNAGPTLGGVDYAMAPGTPLPVLEGVLEWVTPGTPIIRRPAWYNEGLGNAAAYRRDDGTRTVYGHCSSVRADGVVLSGNTGKVRGDGHVHVHDVLKDGRTRARPFSTGGGAGGFAPTLEGDDMSRLIPIVLNDGQTPLRPHAGSTEQNHALIGATGRVETFNLSPAQVDQFKRAGLLGESMQASNVAWVASLLAKVAPLTATIDATVLAQRLAPLLPALDDAERQRIAEAVADEQAERQQQ